MTVVIDASIAIASRVRDRPGTPYADAIIERGKLDTIIVPDLFWHEVRSVLLVAERQGRIEAGTAEDHLEDLRGLSLQTDRDQRDEDVTALARRHNLSGYDAAYLETAKRLHAPLATLDKKLANAAVEEGVAQAGST